MLEIQTEININAPKSKIWTILTDFEQYPEWNPFIISIEGQLKMKQLLKITIEPPEGKKMKFRPRVTSFKFQEEFSWLGSLIMFGIFDGRHSFSIVENPNGSCTFIHQEKFSGLLVPLMRKKLNTETRQGFINMNAALKERAENE